MNDSATTIDSRPSRDRVDAAARVLANDLSSRISVLALDHEPDSGAGHDFAGTLITRKANFPIHAQIRELWPALNLQHGSTQEITVRLRAIDFDALKDDTAVRTPDVFRQLYAPAIVAGRVLFSVSAEFRNTGEACTKVVAVQPPGRHGTRTLALHRPDEYRPTDTSGGVLAHLRPEYAVDELRRRNGLPSVVDVARHVDPTIRDPFS